MAVQFSKEAEYPDCELSQGGCDRDGEHKSNPLPNWHSQKLVLHYETGQVVFHLMHLQTVVKVGDFGQSVGGDEPDFSSAGIGDSNQIETTFNISGHERANALLVQSSPFLSSSFGLIADLPQVSDESAIHHTFQLGGELLTLRCAFGTGDLQILRCDGVIS